MIPCVGIRSNSKLKNNVARYLNGEMRRLGQSKRKRFVAGYAGLFIWKKVVVGRFGAQNGRLESQSQCLFFQTTFMFLSIFYSPRIEIFLRL